MILGVGNLIILVFVMLLVMLVPILLQLFLSTRTNRWYGLILPVVTLLYSIVMMLQVVIFSFGRVIDVFVQLITVFLVSNIPTLVLIVIYAACRTRMEKHAALEKMRLNDLS